MIINERLLRNANQYLNEAEEAEPKLSAEDEKRIREIIREKGSAGAVKELKKLIQNFSLKQCSDYLHKHYQKDFDVHDDKVKKALEEDDTESGEEVVLNEVTNEAVIEMFINDSFPKDKKPEWGTKNLKIKKQPNGWSLVNYDTALLYRSEDGDLKFNTTKYSMSTTTIQNVIRRYLDDAGADYEEVTGQKMGAKLYEEPEDETVEEKIEEKFTSVRTVEEVDAVIDKVIEQSAKGTKWAGMSYEDGLRAMYDFLTGDGEDPMED